MTNDLRRSGIGSVGDIPWGTHFCHFYENQSDLLDMLIPYFRAGLDQNEFCVWGVFHPLDELQARIALERSVPGGDGRLAKGDIELVPHAGIHHFNRLLHDWEVKLEEALVKGYSGMRVNVNPVWLAKKDHHDLDACEKALGRLIANRRIIMSCAYPLAIRHTQEIPEAGYSHRFAIARQQGDWKIVETPELSETRAIVKRLTAELERCDTERRFAAEALCGAQEALRASGERSLCYFELGLVGMATVSPAEGCLEVNDRLCAMLGYQRSELMRMTWSDLAHPDDLTADLQTYDRILTGKAHGVQLAKRWIHKNGDVIQTNVSLKCQRRKDGSVDYFAVMVQEVAGADPTVEGPVLPGPQILSTRELEVARFIGLGRTVKEIAATLELSEKTVSTYRSRILTKLQLKTTSELIRYAIKNRLSG
jgi:PAS domain S-box-containing protein